MIPPRDIGSLCTWCGHPAHADVCPREIQTKSGSTAAAPCPCRRHTAVCTAFDVALTAVQQAAQLTQDDFEEWS